MGAWSNAQSCLNQQGWQFQALLLSPNSQVPRLSAIDPAVTAVHPRGEGSHFVDLGQSCFHILCLEGAKAAPPGFLSDRPWEGQVPRGGSGPAAQGQSRVLALTSCSGRKGRQPEGFAGHSAWPLGCTSSSGTEPDAPPALGRLWSPSVLPGTRCHRLATVRLLSGAVTQSGALPLPQFTCCDLPVFRPWARGVTSPCQSPGGPLSLTKACVAWPSGNSH